jgi:hypothetical protein
MFNSALIEAILARHSIPFTDDFHAVAACGDVYTAIYRSDDPLSIQEHRLLFDAYFHELYGTFPLSFALKDEIILVNRSRKVPTPIFQEDRRYTDSLKDRLSGNTELENEYWRLFQHVYPTAVQRSYVEVDRELKLTIFLQKLNHGSILEIGCGPHAVYLNELQNLYPHLRFFGIDRSLAKPHSANLIEASAQKLPFADQFFDVVYTYAVFVHFSPEECNQAFHEVLRVLKSGGLFILTVDEAKYLANSLQKPLGFTWETYTVKEDRRYAVVIKKN